MSEDTKEWWLMVVLGKSTFVIQLWAELATFFKELIFSWQPTDKIWLFRLQCLADIFFKKMQEACFFKKNNWQYLLPMIKFKLSNKKIEFWRTPICHHELDSFPIFEDFSDEIGGNINEYNVLILYNEKCQNVEDLNNSVFPYFPND